MIFCSLEAQRRLIQTNTTSFFTLSEKKQLTNFQMYTAKDLFPERMLLVPLASINYIFPYDNWKTIFFIKVRTSLPWGSFQSLWSCVVWNKWFKISPRFNFYLRNTNTKEKLMYNANTKVLEWNCHIPY